MRVIPKKDSNSNVYYVYFSGVHNSSCKKHQNEEPKNSKNLKKTASSEHFEKKEDKKQIPSSSKRKAAIKATRKISDQNIKKKKGKSLPLIDLDSTESEDAEKVKNSQKPKENSIESDDEPAAIFIERKFNSPAPLENTSKALNSQPDHQDNKKDDSVLIIQSPASNPLNATSPHIITSTPITSSTSSNNNTQNPSFTSSTIRLNPAPIITLTPSETPRRKKSLENDNSAQTLIMLDNSPTVDLPKDWHFKLESVFIQMDQLAEDLHLKFTSKGSNLAVFSSKERSQTGQVLVLTDQVEDEIFVKVAEYGDWKLISEERWPKASVRQFLYAVRGKLIEFFFVIPNDSISGGSEVNSPVENNDGKSLISGTTATSSSLQFKRESDEDRSTIVSFEGDFIGKDKDRNLEISIQVNIQRINRKKVDDNISMPSDSLPSE
uniref:ULP_PROTEASE domain-containing protein n=1 Tax=Meloidogyne hapla TaxID=6305 RepID=A0A1I8BXU5_MELHA